MTTAVEIDKSPKGSVDPLIYPFMEIINSQGSDIYTTSSCSGRISIFVEKHGETKGFWQFVSHSRVLIDAETLTTKTQSNAKEVTANEHLFGGKKVEFTTISNDLFRFPAVTFKFEPFILHVSADTNKRASEFLQVAYKSGFAYSACVMGKSRCMVQVKSSLKLDVPLGFYDDENETFHVIVDREYLCYLVHLSNQKFDVNENRMQVFLENLKEFFKK